MSRASSFKLAVRLGRLCAVSSFSSHMTAHCKTDARYSIETDMEILISLPKAPLYSLSEMGALSLYLLQLLWEIEKFSADPAERKRIAHLHIILTELDGTRRAQSRAIN